MRRYISELGPDARQCRCCRVWWPAEAFTKARLRVDGSPILRGSCEACRKRCGPGRRASVVAGNRRRRAHLRAAVEQVRLARARAMWDNTGGGVSAEPNRLFAATAVVLLTPGDSRRFASGSKSDA